MRTRVPTCLSVGSGVFDTTVLRRRKQTLIALGRFGNTPHVVFEPLPLSRLRVFGAAVRSSLISNKLTKLKSLYTDFGSCAARDFWNRGGATTVLLSGLRLLWKVWVCAGVLLLFCRTLFVERRQNHRAFAVLASDDRPFIVVGPITAFHVVAPKLQTIPRVGELNVRDGGPASIW